jgi:hypothetical protein
LRFNVLFTCPKDELHQWFIGFQVYGEHIIPAIVYHYTATQMMMVTDPFKMVAFVDVNIS